MLVINTVDQNIYIAAQKYKRFYLAGWDKQNLFELYNNK